MSTRLCHLLLFGFGSLLPHSLAVPRELNAAPPLVAVHVEAIAVRGFAAPGTSGVGAFAQLVLSATRGDNGAPVPGLGAKLGDGTGVIGMPKGWALETLARPLGDSGCPLQPTAFLEAHPGIYFVRVIPGTCPWRAGTYSLGAQFKVPLAGVTHSGTGTVALVLEGFDDGLLTNGGFDHDLLAWAGSAQAVWSADDADQRAGSGSAAYAVRQGVICDSLRQCVAIGPGLYELAAKFRPSATGVVGQGVLGLSWYATGDCSGPSLNVTEAPLPAPTAAGAWTRLSLVEHSLQGTHSVHADVSFCKVNGDTSGTSRVDVDAVSLRRLGERDAASAPPSADVVYEVASDEAITKHAALSVQVQALNGSAVSQGTSPDSYAWLAVTATRQDNGQPILDLATNQGNGSAPITLPSGWFVETLTTPAGVQGCAVVATAVRNLRPSAKGSYLVQVVPAAPGCRWHEGTYSFAIRLSVDRGNTRLQGRGSSVLTLP